MSARDWAIVFLQRRGLYYCIPYSQFDSFWFPPLINAFPAEEFSAIKSRLSDFLFEMAVQIQARLPDNVAILKKINIMAPKNLLGGGIVRELGALATSFQTVGGEPFDVSALEGECRRLRNTTLDVNRNSPSLVFWSAIAAFRNGDNLIFPQLTRLSSVLICLPVSNATVERLFSAMAVIKTKLRNSLAIPMVEAILSVRYGFKRRGENCSTFEILPAMLTRFNTNMYDHKRPKTTASIEVPDQGNEVANEGNDDEEFIQVLNDVEELFGEPVFLTH